MTLILWVSTLTAPTTSGAEALAIMGLIINIITFVDYGNKVVDRLHDGKEIPKALRDIKTEPPLLLNTLNETKEQAEASMINEDTQTALSPMVNGCLKQVQEVEDILVKVLPVE